MATQNSELLEPVHFWSPQPRGEVTAVEPLLGLSSFLGSDPAEHKKVSTFSPGKGAGAACSSLSASRGAEPLYRHGCFPVPFPTWEEKEQQLLWAVPSLQPNTMTLKKKRYNYRWHSEQKNIIEWENKTQLVRKPNPSLKDHSPKQQWRSSYLRYAWEWKWHLKMQCTKWSIPLSKIKGSALSEHKLAEHHCHLCGPICSCRTDDRKPWKQTQTHIKHAREERKSSYCWRRAAMTPAES